MRDENIQFSDGPVSKVRSGAVLVSVPSGTKGQVAERNKSLSEGTGKGKRSLDRSPKFQRSRDSQGFSMVIQMGPKNNGTADLIVNFFRGC